MSRYKKRQTPDLFVAVKAYIPKTTFEFLREFSDHVRVPMSRLIAIAVDNELDQGENKFNYPDNLPDHVEEFEYAAEAQKIIPVLEKCNAGMAVDTLLICRREIGIERREDMLGGIKELLDRGIVEWFKPRRTTYAYLPSYRRIRIKGLSQKQIRKKKFKRIEGVKPRGYDVDS